MNLLQLKQEIGRLLSDPNNDRWSAATLTTRINLAQTEIQGTTNAVKQTENVDIVQGTNNYTLAYSVINVLNVYIQDSDGNSKKLPEMGRSVLDYNYPLWRTMQNGTPFSYNYDSTQKILTLVPPPDYSKVTGLLVLESRIPADLSSDTDVPFDSNAQMIPYHSAIVHWVVSRCFMDDGTPEALAKARFHKSGSMMNPGEYEKQIGRITQEFDADPDINARVLWRPSGGRTGVWYVPSKSNPLPWP